MPSADARQLLSLMLAALQPRNGSYPTVVVDGRGASGKSSFGAWLSAGLPGFVVINGDDYFEPNDDPITWGDFNEDRFDAEILAALRAGERELTVRPYDYAQGRRADEITVPVLAGVVVERCFGFALEVDWDFRIWVDAPRAVCLTRGIERDSSEELGERVRLAWEQVWRPREDDYIASTRPQELADMVIDGTRPFAEQMTWSASPSVS